MSRLLAGLTGVAVLVTGGALLAVPGDPAPAAPDRAPSTTALTRQQLLCPTLPNGAGTVASTRAAGEVRVGLGSSEPVAVRRHAAAAVGASTAATAYVVEGRRDLAPGLVGGVSAARAGAAAACLPAAADAWFTGVGAAALHRSTLQLVNPDASPAVARLDLLGPRGPVDARSVRSVTVPGRSATTVDLAARVPTRSELAVHVSVERGRLGAAVVDTVSDLATTTASDVLPAQAAPATRSVLLGLPSGDSSSEGERRLVLANPGEDQAAVQLQVVDDRSTFTPTGVDPVEVPAGSVVAMSLPPSVARAVADGRAGLQVTSDRPVTATVRSLAGGDLSHAVASPSVTEAALLVPTLPGGRATLTLAAPGTAATATVTAYDDGGRRLQSRRLAVRRLTLARLALPARTALLTVTTSGPALAGAVRVVAASKVVTQPLTPLVTTALVPSVAPAPPG